MKIAIIVSTFPPYAGGIGNVAAANAIELQKLGHKVTIFTPEYEVVKEEVTGLDVKRVKTLVKFGNAAFVPKLGKLILGYDIIHVHYPFFGGAEVIWHKAKKLKKFGKKIIVHYHMDVVGSGFKKIFFNFHTKFILPKIVKVADKVIFTSLDYGKHSNVKNLLEKTPDKFIEVPNGVDIDWFRPESKNTELLKRYDVNDEKVVCFVGGLDSAHYFKGIEYLIEAMSRLKQASYKWRLLIVGDGDLRQEYKDLAGQFTVDGRTIFAGYVSNKELPAHYNLADVVVLPSVDKSEAFGLALVEGMSCGKPTVATNLAGVRSVVDDKVTGLLAEPRNADDLATKINYILSNDDVAMQYGKAGRQKVEKKYNWKQIAAQLEKIYIS